MKIVVDAFGGDNAPAEIIKGVVQAVNAEDGFNVVLVGNEDIIKEELSSYDYQTKRIEILDAPEVITNEDIPTQAIRKKKNSSIVKSLGLLNSDDSIKAFVSAGSTGAVLTGAVLMLKRIKGINRPALCPVLPTIKGGQAILIDCGANVDSKPLNLVQFAHMGNAYAKSVLGIQMPRIGLLSNGVEEGKGNEFTKEVYNLLRDEVGINFVGNMEGRDILSGDYDVVVSDGMAGNIALKSSEGAAMALFELLKQNIMGGGLRAKLGYLLLKPAFKKVKKIMDYNDNGGAILLGLTKIVVKCHGSSKAKSIKASVLQAKMLVDSGVVDAISDALPK